MAPRVSECQRPTCHGHPARAHGQDEDGTHGQEIANEICGQADLFIDFKSRFEEDIREIRAFPDSGLLI